MSATILQASQADELPDLRTATDFGFLTAAEWALAPDRHFVLHEAGQLHARCSVWLDRLPRHNKSQPAAIGHFEAVTMEAGTTVLEAASAWIREQGRGTAIGPINANTWHKYRLITDRGSRPPFILEPWHPPFYVDAWAQAGFHPMAEFHSAQMPPQTEADPRMARVQKRFEQSGLHIRNLDLSNFDADLRRILSVSTISFARNLLYTDCPEAMFLDLYRPLKAHIRPEFIWLAEHDGRCVGFCFCVPDLAQVQNGTELDTLIVKSLATLPGRDYAGLGLLLTQKAHAAASAVGFRTVIHALMHPGSQIKHFGKTDMTIFRRYTLFSRAL